MVNLICFQNPLPTFFETRPLLQMEENLISEPKQPLNPSYTQPISIIPIYHIPLHPFAVTLVVVEAMVVVVVVAVGGTAILLCRLMATNIFILHIGIPNLWRCHCLQPVPPANPLCQSHLRRYLPLRRTAMAFLASGGTFADPLAYKILHATARTSHMASDSGILHSIVNNRSTFFRASYCR